ncbi:hypothetical protein DSM112329_03429 [Paraconexibacter sp. AEG42_29]|uniref:Uncharacterized protein n=1 Tax=Paraconexibacter sp. AEG42_29 TaxID=2997339 RepID=A0AAU7AYJ6_9ACTN
MDDEQPSGTDKPRTDLSSIRDLPPPAKRPERKIRVELLPYDQRTGVSAHDRLMALKASRPSAAQALARTLAGFAAAAAVLVAIFFALSAVDDDSTPTAPWAKPGAPIVQPDSLSGQ